MEKDIDLTVDMLKALADKRRLKIIDLLSCGKMCVCELVDSLELSQPNISHHLKILKKEDLIIGTKRGKWVDYELNNEKFELLKQNLDLIISKDSERSEEERINC